MQARLLCVGDMHLGRRPSRLPGDLEANHGIHPDALDPRAAWRATVERAIAEDVDAVLLAGDVVDAKNHFMEAYGALQEGARRLAAKNIDLICVAGNHDVEALPRLADELPSVHLLGRRGSWESHVVRRDGEALVRVIGWSFPKTHVESNPLDAMGAEMRAGNYDDVAPNDLRTVGLLHCDLDASGSRYAPVSRASLAQLDVGISAWFLGHVHAPSIQGGGRPVGYLGSLVGLDPGEPGQHGPWLTTSAAGSWEMEQIPLSPVRFETLDVNIEECADTETILSAMMTAARELEERLRPEMEGTRVVGLRPRLVGTTAVTLPAIKDAMEQGLQLEINPDSVFYFVEKVVNASRPRVDLAALAGKNDPVGILARRILDLEQGAEACAAFIAGARPRLDAVASHGNFSHLGQTGTSDEQIREILLRLARRALEELLSQKYDTSAERAAEEILA